MDASLKERLDHDVKSNRVLLFMKGTPAFPQCGFSNQVVQILRHYGVPFQSVNVLRMRSQSPSLTPDAPSGASSTRNRMAVKVAQITLQGPATAPGRNGSAPTLTARSRALSIGMCC
jgi:hypothetical protein